MRGSKCIYWHKRTYYACAECQLYVKLFTHINTAGHLAQNAAACYCYVYG